MTNTPGLEVAPSANTGISQITVAGFKSIYDEQSIEIRPLTILAGANSSGKSSIMQPLLLLKQTLEATYDPGPLLLNGPNVHFALAKQMFSISKNGTGKSFDLGVWINKHSQFRIRFTQANTEGIRIRQINYFVDGREFDLHEGMAHDELASLVNFKEEQSNTSNLGGITLTLPFSISKRELVVSRNRCFLVIALSFTGPNGENALLPLPGAVPAFDPLIRDLIHLPGLRGNPVRAYPITATGPTFPGTFENYTASIVAHWETNKGPELAGLINDLRQQLGLTSNIRIRRVDDTQVELQVGRTIRGSKSSTEEWVNIADVGFGVSQALPVLVALRAARPGQLVYLEQPELHLHPRAQQAMAQILAEAAIRGVRVVAETHSALLLLGVQTLVAEGKLPPHLVKLHWFTRGEDGKTHISSADLDENGAFGEWPEDFGMVELDAQSRYLDAVEGRHFGMPTHG